MAKGKIHLRMPNTLTSLCGRACLDYLNPRSTILINKTTCKHCLNYIEDNMEWYRLKWGIDPDPNKSVNRE